MTESLESRLTKELAPDLEVIRSIGKGSVSHVYLARDPGLKRLVAVKVLRRELASDELARKRFEREAQAAARLNHSNVTDIYRIGHLDDGIPFIIMEYIDGRTIADLTKATGPLPVEQVRELLADVAGGLAAAHRHNVVHRDVRPSNIMRENRTDRTVLMDFGIAGLLESGGETFTRLTAQGVRLGDLRYMSPEQMRGETVTTQADIYSLGVVGFELLTGESPFGAAPGVQAMAAQLRGERRHLSDLRPELDRSLVDLIDRCMATVPEQRPTAGDMLAILRGPPSGPGPAEYVPTTALGAFMTELKRRHVYRVAGAYVIAMLMAVEGANNLLVDPGFMPEEWFRVLVVFVMIGFPVAIALAWIFDFRGGRISRTTALPEVEEAARGRPIRWLLPWVALGLVVILAILFGWLRLR